MEATASIVVPTQIQGRKFWMLHRGKKPVNPSEPVASRKRWLSSQNHTTYTKALELLEQYPGHDGLCMILREEDNLLFIDGDHVRDPESGEIHSGFTDIVTMLAPGGAWSEVSLSGTGVHVILDGQLPKGYKKGKIDLQDGVHVEFFDKKRVCVVTGDLLGDNLDIPPVDPDTLSHLLHERSTTRKKVPRTVNASSKIYDQGWISDLPISIRHTEGGTDDAPNVDPSAWRDSKSKTSACHFLETDMFYDRREDQSFGRVGLFAYEQGIISRPWEDCTGDRFIEVMNRARELGIKVPERETKEPVSTIPIQALKNFSPAGLKRYQNRRKISAPDTGEIRDRIGTQVTSSMKNAERICITSPTGTGKTHSIASQKWTDENGKRAKITGDQPVVLLSPTRKARDSAYATGRSQGHDINLLQGVDELCPVAGGEFDTPELEKELGEMPSEWFKKLQSRGLRSWRIHKILERKLGHCPCRIDGICDSEAQHSGGLRKGKSPRHDLTIACHPYAYSPQMIRNCNVIIDENPVFEMSFPYASATSMVNAKLRTFDTIGPNNIEELLEWSLKLPHYDSSAERDNAPEWENKVRNFLSSDASADWVEGEPDAHIMSGALVRACFNAFRKETVFDVNGIATGEAVYRECQRNAEGEILHMSRHRIYVTIEKSDFGLCVKHVWNIPDLSEARSVIVLDATPIPEMVELLVGKDCKHTQLLTKEEEKNWRVINRRQLVIDVSGGAVRPSATGRYFGKDAEVAIMKKIQEFAPLKTAICSKKEEEPLREAMQEAGILDPKIMTYGSQRSLNDFGTEPVGYITGSIDAGDGFINHQLALFGYSATPTRSEKVCDHCHSSGCSKCQWTGLKRKHGREFEGDTEKARMFLESVRENNVVQAIGRYARPTEEAFTKAYDAGTKFTIVFVRTSAIPSHYVDGSCHGVTWTASEKQKKILYALDGEDYKSAKEIAEAVGCTKKHAIETLATFVEIGSVRCWESAGKYGANLYKLLSDEPLTGVVDLDLIFDEGKIVTDCVLNNNYTWSYTIGTSSDKPEIKFTPATMLAATDGGEPEQIPPEQVGDPPDG